MDFNSFGKIYNKIFYDLCNNSLGCALMQVKEIAQKEQYESILTQIDDIEVSYNYMIQYYKQGVDDPKRIEIYNDITIKLLYVLDRIRRNIMSVDSPSMYYSTLRYYRMKNLSLTSLFSVRNSLKEKIELMKISEDNQISLNSTYKELECVEEDIFSMVFILNTQQKEDISVIQSVLNKKDENDYFKELLISAITLSCIEYFDEDKIALLYNCYSYSNSIPVRVKALIGLYIISNNYSDIMRFSNKIMDLNNELIGNKNFDDDIRAIVLQFVKSVDTERITKKTHQDLIEKLNKIGPSVYRKIKGLDFSANDEEENPDWQKILEESGIDDKVKELSEMQMQGADILMGTFAKLKYFSFFNKAVNWFMPFHKGHYLICQNKEFEKLLNVLNKTSFMCDSDKFSFLLAVNSAPAAERKVMVSQLESQNIELQELALSEIQTDKSQREKQIMLYCQNLYRFFQLYNQAKSLKNPFTCEPFSKNNIIVRTDKSNNELIKIAAEFYLKRKYYDRALNLYNLLLENGESTFDIYQKIGLCYQNNRNYFDALTMYKRADILNSDNSWSLRHIAYCYKNLNLEEEALSYYKQAEKVDPDNLKLLLLIGNLYLELGNADMALKYYYKVDYLSQDQEKVIRLIFWSEFLTNNFERSLDAFNRLKNKEADDFLNLGHVKLVSGDIKSAINAYRECLNKHDCDIDKFKTDFFADQSVLISKGISKNELSIIFDSTIN